MLLFDYDGTLTPIVEHPRLAMLICTTPAACWHGLAKRPRVEVGVLSGRALDDLKSLLGLPGLYSGRNRRAGIGTARHSEYGHPRAVPGRQPDAEPRPRSLEQCVADYPGAWVENKQYA